MRHSRKAKSHAFTLVEIMVAAGLLALTTIIMTQAMLVLNKNAAVARVRNLAKAAALSRIQEAGAVKFDPLLAPPAPLVETADAPAGDVINLGDATTGLGLIPAKSFWIVKADATTKIRTIKCRVTYNYLGRDRAYEVLTFRSPD